MTNSITTKITISFILSILLLGTGCSSSEGESESSDNVKNEILKALKNDYPPDKKPDGETTNFELFKFEPLKEKPAEAEKGWCVNFLFTNKVDASSKPSRWIGYGNVIKKDGKYSYQFSSGCKLSDEEQKKINELKNLG